MPTTRPGKLLSILLFFACGGASPAAIAQESDESPEPRDRASNSFIEALTGGQVRALLRYNAMYRNSNLHSTQDSSEPIPPTEKTQQYSALGGYVGYETAPWHGFSAGVTVYTSQPAGNNPGDRRGLGGLYEQNGGQDPYTVPGEAFLRLQSGGHRLTAGRQEMPQYRMVSLSDIRMTPITHSGIAYDNTSFAGLRISAAYVERMKERNEKTFVGMARGARLAEVSQGKPLIRGDYNPNDYRDNQYAGPAKSMALAGAVYAGDGWSLEAWNYNVEDLLNSVYLYGSYELASDGLGFVYTLAGQYTRQNDIGGHVAGNIDTWHWGVRLSASSPAITWFAAYNEVDYNQDSYDGGTLFVRWGTPQMFNSFQVQDSELAGTRSWGAGLQYDFGVNGRFPGLVMRWRYAYYDMPDELTMTDARQDRSEATFDLRYYFSKATGQGIFTQDPGWSLLFRLAWDDYRTDYDFLLYREIHGYTFETVTNNFADARLYVEYLF